MKKVGQVCGIGQKEAQKYIEYHQNIPEAIRRLIYDCNIRNYSIFIRDGLLFTYYEYIGNDYAADMQKMEQNADNQKWWDLVKPIMSPLPTRKEGEFWADMELIFEQD